MSAISSSPSPCMFCQKEVDACTREKFPHEHKAHFYCWTERQNLTPSEELTCVICEQVIGKQVNAVKTDLNVQGLLLSGKIGILEIKSKAEIDAVTEKANGEAEALRQQAKGIASAVCGPFKVAGKTVLQHLEEAQLPKELPASFHQAFKTDSWVPFFTFRASRKPHEIKGYYCLVLGGNDVQKGLQQSRLYISLDKPVYYFDGQKEEPLDSELPTLTALTKAMKLYCDDAVNTHWVPLQEVENFRPGGKSVWQAVNELPTIIHEDLDGISGKKPEGLDPFFQQALAMEIPILFAQLCQNKPEKHKSLDQGKIGCAVAIHIPGLEKTEVTPYLAYTGTPQWEWRSKDPDDYAETQTFVEAFYERLEKNSRIYRLEDVKAFIKGKDFIVSNWTESLAKYDLSTEADLLEEELAQKCTREQPVFTLIRNQHDKIFLCSKRKGHPMQTRRIRIFKDHFWYEMNGADKMQMHEVQSGDISSHIRIHYSKQRWMDVYASETNEVFDDVLAKVPPLTPSEGNYRQITWNSEDSNWRDKLFGPCLSVAAFPESAGDSMGS